MKKRQLLERLIQILLEEMPQSGAPATEAMTYVELRALLRNLMTVRPPTAASAEFLAMQDELLSAEREEAGVVDPRTLPRSRKDPRVCLWQGDITRLAADAIVNAANSRMLGCWVPGHACIDNAIHSAAGVQLRIECEQIMHGREAPTGGAIMTSGYNLPAHHVLHTVGPIIHGPLTDEDRTLLASCYHSCLQAAADAGLESIAFCSISTGVFRFPKDEAARIAVGTVREFLDAGSPINVIFNVFSEADHAIYSQLI